MIYTYINNDTEKQELTDLLERNGYTFNPFSAEDGIVAIALYIADFPKGERKRDYIFLDKGMCCTHEPFTWIRHRAMVSKDEFAKIIDGSQSLSPFEFGEKVEKVIGKKLSWHNSWNKYIDD